MAVPFRTIPFADGALGTELVACSHDRNPEVANKSQVRYLEQHLRKLGCATMLVEPFYTDRSFLEDYAAYYVRCFEPYRHVCTRLHFFGEPLSQAQVSDAIVRDDAAMLDSYLGFIVVKPLPITVIGRTCLKPHQVPGRAYPPVKPQMVDLYGLRLCVDTLPFQEQDREVAACASSSLWTMLHSTAALFQHHKPSPVEITKAATTHARVNGRTFPNGDGLNTLQIADAIRSVGLEPFLLAVSSMPRMAIPYDEFAVVAVAGARIPRATPELVARMRLMLKVATMAYLRSGIACTLLARISDETDQDAGALGPEVGMPDPELTQPQAEGEDTSGPAQRGNVEHRGNHAVAVTGFALGVAGVGETFPGSATRFAAAGIVQLEVHDDQTGPFSTMRFDEGNLLVAEDFRAAGVARRLAEPINLVVPLYHKIRIPLQQVVDLIMTLDEALDTLPVATIREKLVWDVELISLEALRDDFARTTLPEATKLELLTAPLPRFVWRVRALQTGKPAFDLLLDATDLLQGRLVRRVIPYDAKLCKELAILFSLSADRFDPILRPTLEAFSAQMT